MVTKFIFNKKVVYETKPGDYVHPYAPFQVVIVDNTYYMIRAVHMRLSVKKIFLAEIPKG
jgi:hypothetical protein